MKKKLLLGVSIICVIILIIVKNSNLNNAEKNSKFKIITSFYPMYIATLNITDGVSDVEVKNLTKPTIGCLHDYQLSPQEMVSIEKSNVFIVNGAGMESFMDKVISSYPKLKIIDASNGIELLKDKNGKENAHVWVSVSEHIKQVNNIKNKLCEIDRKNSEKYNKNANIYISKLEMQKQKMKNSLKNITKKDIVTFHEAFPYFAKEFGLNIVAVVEREPGTEPSPDELVETIKAVKASNVKILFAEPQYSKSSASVIASESGAKVYMLDPVVTGNMNKNAYIDIMDKNLQVLEEALK